MSKEKLVSIGVIILVVVAIGSLAVFGARKTSSSKISTVADNVALVNGVPITRATFKAQLTVSTTTLAAQGVPVTSADKLAEIKTQVLNDLINSELVSQGITKDKIAVTADEIETQFQNILKQAGGAEQLKAQIAKINLTEVELRQNIAKQLNIQKYLLKNVDISSATTTEAEIKKFYDDNTKSLKNPPSLKDVSDQIRQQIIANKQQLLVNAFLSALRAGAEIKTYLQ